MSGMWKIWSANGVWYGSRWIGASPEQAGPFDTREEAMKWATGKPWHGIEPPSLNKNDHR